MHSSLVERSSECQDTFLVEVAALRSFIDAKAFKCNSAPHCNVIEKHCTIRAIRSSKHEKAWYLPSAQKHWSADYHQVMAYWQVVSHSTRWSSSFILGPLHWSSIFIFLTSREHKNIVQWCTNWQATLAQYFTCCYSSFSYVICSDEVQCKARQDVNKWWYLAAWNCIILPFLGNDRILFGFCKRLDKNRLALGLSIVCHHTQMAYCTRKSLLTVP